MLSPAEARDTLTCARTLSRMDAVEAAAAAAAEGDAVLVPLLLLGLAVAVAADADPVDVVLFEDALRVRVPDRLELERVSVLEPLVRLRGGCVELAALDDVGALVGELCEDGRHKRGLTYTQHDHNHTFFSADELVAGTAAAPAGGAAVSPGGGPTRLGVRLSRFIDTVALVFLTVSSLPAAAALPAAGTAEVRVRLLSTLDFTSATLRVDEELVVGAPLEVRCDTAPVSVPDLLALALLLLLVRRVDVDDDDAEGLLVDLSLIHI